VVELIITLVKERIPKRFGFDPIDDIQVLTPMHRGIVGGTNLNVELQKALNPGEEGVSRMGRLYRVGDKVMQISNNYDKEVYNGDIGRITGIDTEAQEVSVAIDNREVLYDFSELDELVHAYAVSIHKSQGSEYLAVVIPILTQHYILLQRNLLYTGVTRGKKLVVIIGTKKAMAIAIRNNKTEKRYTLLSERLRS
jgi:exodeoxyribonuclease V alpha subunit